MPEYKELKGVTYRVATAKYNGLYVSNCLIPESDYKGQKDKKTRFKKLSQTPRDYLAKRLDEAWSVAIKLRDNHTCQKCGAKGVILNSHHIFSRSHKGTRWNLNNGVTLCAGCHTLNNGSAHKDPEIFREWLLTFITQRDYDLLIWSSCNYQKFTTGELDILLKSLKNYCTEKRA